MRARFYNDIVQSEKSKKGEQAATLIAATISIGRRILGSHDNQTEKCLWDNVDWITFMISMSHVYWNLLPITDDITPLQRALTHDPPNKIVGQFPTFFQDMLLTPWLTQCQQSLAKMLAASISSPLRDTMVEVVNKLQEPTPAASRIVQLHDAMITLNILAMASSSQYEWVARVLDSDLLNMTVSSKLPTKDRESKECEPGFSYGKTHVPLIPLRLKPIKHFPGIRPTERLAQCVWMSQELSRDNAIRIWFHPWNAILASVDEITIRSQPPPVLI